MGYRYIRDSFDRVAEQYEHHAALENEVCSRLLERVEFRRRDPERILDLGCGTGAGCESLKQYFGPAQVVGLDASTAMLSALRRRSAPLDPLCADLGQLPIAAQSMDLVFSNMALHWCPDPMRLFAEIRRVLRPSGMLLFSTLGAASMRQLRQAWLAVDSAAELPAFPDLLELGDALVAAGFREPVMDTDQITLDYPTLRALCTELQGTGTAMLYGGWQQMTARLPEFERAYSPLKAEGRYPLGFEVVYGAAFGPEEGQPRRTGDGEIATFSVDSLMKTRAGKGAKS